MDLKQIQELVKIVNKSGISELQVKEGDLEVTIKAVGMMNYQPQQQVVYTQAPQQLHSQPQMDSGSNGDTPAAPVAMPSADTFTFKSPMIGTFYRKPGPDKEIFVKIGDSIKKGDVLCIIEAMKLFNEIEYDGDAGRVVKILVDDSSPVEYDQPLFVIERE
jgi:acetyl-CoA carboxylase biotin carboxyl carrier protein